MRTYIYIFILFAAFGCRRETSHTLKIREFSGNGYLNRTTKGVLATRRTRDSIIYVYSSDTLNYDYIFTKLKSEDRRLLYNNLDLLFIDSKILLIRGSKIKIDRFEFPEPTIPDGDASIYFVDNSGVISIVSDSGTNTILFDKGGQLDKDIFAELEKDTTGFYRYPPPRRQ